MTFHLDPSRDRKLTRLVRGSPLQSFRRGRWLYRADDSATHLYHVDRGYVCLTLAEIGSGGGRTVAVAGPGELFGAEALVPDSKRLYGACAGESVDVRAVPGREAASVVRGSRRTYEALLSTLESQLATARRSAAGNASPPTPRRLAEAVLELCGRLGIEGEGKERTRVPHWIPHRVLAELTGAHRSTVTTLLNDWSYQGLLRHDRSSLVLLSDRDDLLEAAASPD